jgi:dipeptidyl aminopeptidase/acylaminoacyl peptidase
MKKLSYFYMRIIILGIFWLFTLQAQVKKPYTMTDQLKLDIPSNPVISLKGDKVLFTIRKADLLISKWVTQVYILDIATKNYYQFTKDGESCTDAKFSPDEKWITFLSDREYLNSDKNAMASDAGQLWAAPLSGGEAHNWTALPGGVSEYCWSHDSKKIAFLSDEYNEQKEKEKAENEKVKKDDHIYDEPNTVKVLDILDVATGKIFSSFNLDAGAANISFSSDDQKVVYQTNYTGEYNDEQKYDIYAIDMAGNKVQLTNEVGPETSPKYSPDGKLIAYITQTVPDIEFAQTDLDIMNSDGSGRTNLTKGFDLSVNNYCWMNNNTIIFTVDEGTNEPLYKITISTGKIEKLTNGNMVLSDISLSDNGDLCYDSQSSNTLNEIFVNSKKLTDFSQQLSQYNPGTQEAVSYKSRDGKYKIEGILFKPDNFDPTKKYSLIVTPHGGPYESFKNTFTQIYGTKIWTDKGYLVFAPNPRGSSGYSDEFAQANRYDLGGGDYRDIMDGVDYLISKGFVDAARMGVTGGSYGGYMTNWIISQTNRFHAAVSMYGIFSLLTDWSNSFQPSWEKMYLGYYYWEKPINMDNQYVSKSPAFYVQNITTPTLIMQGDRDVYTNISNSREMYQALNTRGLPVEFIVFPREGHGLRNEPNHYIDVVERATNWFEKYIPSN